MGLTSSVSAGNNFTNKTSFSFDVKDCLVSQGMLGRSKKVLQAQKASSFIQGRVVGGSLLVFSCCGEMRGWVARSTALWAVLIRASNASESQTQNHMASLRKSGRFLICQLS